MRVPRFQTIYSLKSCYGKNFVFWKFGENFAEKIPWLHFNESKISAIASFSGIFCTLPWTMNHIPILTLVSSENCFLFNDILIYSELHEDNKEKKMKIIITQSTFYHTCICNITIFVFCNVFKQLMSRLFCHLYIKFITMSIWLC